MEKMYTDPLNKLSRYARNRTYKDEIEYTKTSDIKQALVELRDKHATNRDKHMKWWDD